MDKKTASLLFSLFLLLLFSGMAWEAAGFTELARFFPFYISIIGAVFCTVQTIFLLKEWIRDKEEKKSPNLQIKAPTKYIGWIIGYVLLIYIFGLMAATGTYLILFLTMETRLNWWKTAGTTVLVLLFLNFFSIYMNLYWPENLMGW
ncbi:tripartite tricarboxylate transporter TctB family protein [Salibacterium aidingense]|uniref:tripartite tricarboxylate transporter TctB family protein n=1 Tax=Salibacterium aidingense TaxID=384933 RepID=UPI000422A7B1|nr:tripartite tricarboxylate transporter TctB family protein [Salibacterium aidingense]